MVQRLILTSSHLGRDAAGHIRGQGIFTLCTTKHLGSRGWRWKEEPVLLRTSFNPDYPVSPKRVGLRFDSYLLQSQQHQQGPFLTLTLPSLLCSVPVPAIRTPLQKVPWEWRLAPFKVPFCTGVTWTPSQEPSVYQDWVLPSSLMLHSLVCPQTHRNPPGYGNKCPKQCISKNFPFGIGQIGGYFVSPPHALPTFKLKRYTCFFWCVTKTMRKTLSGLENHEAVLAQCPLFCLLIPLGHHVCCSKWFNLAGPGHFPRLPLLWW